MTNQNLSNAHSYQSHQLPQAIAALTSLERPLDLVVVKNFVADRDLLVSLDDGPRNFDQLNKQRLYEVAPSLREADQVIQDLWRRYGYSNTAVDEFKLDILLYNGGRPHLDDAPLPDYIPAIVQGSLCISGSRLFGAERIEGDFRTRRGSFDRNAYDSFQNNWINSPAHEVEVTDLRTRQVLFPGDLVLFPQFPDCSVHGVKDLETPSRARLLTWYATKS